MYTFVCICRVCVYIYIYISINHFKSLCGKNKRSVTERATNSRRRRASNSSYTPAELRRKKLKYKWKKIKTFFVCMYKFASCFQYK